MELTPQDIDLIERFLRNELSEKEASEFQSRIAGDIEFATEVKSYQQTLKTIDIIGRQQLFTSLSDIKVQIEKENGFDNYRPGTTTGKRKGGSGFTKILFVILCGVVSYLYFSGKLSVKYIEHYFKSTEVDTVYHYQVKVDTVKVGNFDSARQGSNLADDTIKNTNGKVRIIEKVIKYQKPDTVYYYKHAINTNERTAFPKSKSESNNFETLAPTDTIK